MSTEIEKKMKTLDIAKKMITLETSDKETFVIEEAVALKLQTIRHMIEDDCADNVIPLSNVTSKGLAKVIEYCSKHVEEESKNGTDQDKGSLEKWDAEYIAMDERELFYLLLAADFLNVQGLLDLAVQAVADRIKGKDPEEIRKEFNIKNDMPPELEEEIRSNNQWAFEVRETETETESATDPGPSTSYYSYVETNIKIARELTNKSGDED